jgi:hypothetical protein
MARHDSSGQLNFAVIRQKMANATELPLCTPPADPTGGFIPIQIGGYSRVAVMPVAESVCLDGDSLMMSG